MKHIVDIYEEGEVVSTSDNTMGIGNPLPAGVNGNEGSEPLPKKKRKCAKCQKEVKEGIMDIEGTLEADKTLLNFVEWYVNNIIDNLSGPSRPKEELITELLHGVVSKGKGVYIIDSKKIPGLDELYIPKTGIPNWIKTIKFINLTSLNVYSFSGDISNTDIEVYRDNERTYGLLSMSFKMSSASDAIKLGKITCDELYIRHPKMETLRFDNNSIILDLRLDDCKKLQSIYGSLMNCCTVHVPKNYAARQLKEAGIVPWSANLLIF